MISLDRPKQPSQIAEILSARIETNHLFSVEAMTDAAGNLIETYDYDSHGAMSIADAGGAVLSESSVGNAYGFTGRRLDAESGLYYFRARYFDVGLGRFISRDPLRYVDGVSLYFGYFVPQSTDPTGLKTICCKEIKERWETLDTADAPDVEGYENEGFMACILERLKETSPGTHDDVTKPNPMIPDRPPTSHQDNIEFMVETAVKLVMFTQASKWCRTRKCVKEVPYTYTYHKKGIYFLGTCLIDWLEQEKTCDGEEMEVDRDGFEK